MQNKRILHLAKLTMSEADRKKLTKRRLGFIAAMAFAVDEISIFQKLYVQSLVLQPSDDDLLLIHALQHNAIARVLAAKLFEGIGLFEKYSVATSRRGDAAKEQVELNKYSDQLAKLKAMPGHGLAEAIRNHATNHYIAKEAEKNLDFVSERAQYVLFLDEMQGNSFFPLGEEVVFMGRIGRYFSESFNRTYTMEDIDHWRKWTVSTSRWLTGMFTSYILWLQNNEFPHWRLVPVKPYLEMELFSEIGDTPLPLFYSADKYRKKRKGSVI